VSKELHVSAHESHLQAYKYGTSKTNKVQLSAGHIHRDLVYEPELGT